MSLADEALTAVGNRILIRLDRLPTESDGGAILPDTLRRNPEQRVLADVGTVVAAGPGRVSKKGAFLENVVKKGDRVVMRSHTQKGITEWIHEGGEIFVWTVEEKILAKLEE